ncbi:hypothetical protein J7J83_01045 [bacterium]|nr:hypothetical protein [bacterium]
MANKKTQPGIEKEIKTDVLEKRHEEEQQQAKEVHEAKTEVGLEAGEIIQSAEVPSGEVSEYEKKNKEGNNGGGIADQAKTQAGLITKPTYPSVKKMSSQVEKELKKEIKDLHKKVKSVMKKKGNLDAAQLNTLMARLRKLKDVLASLAYATADIVRDMWHKYVKSER